LASLALAATTGLSSWLDRQVLTARRRHQVPYFDPSADGCERAGKVVGDVIAVLIMLAALILILHNVLS
jgi:hypothetical protein